MARRRYARVHPPFAAAMAFVAAPPARASSACTWQGSVRRFRGAHAPVTAHGRRCSSRDVPRGPGDAMCARDAEDVSGNWHSPVSASAAVGVPVDNVGRAGVLTLLSTIVGVLVLIGSLLYKLPQMVRIWRRRSAAGISVLMYALETIGTTFSSVYFVRRGFPFSSFGETTFIMVQNCIILSLIVFFEKLPRVGAVVCALSFSTLLTLLCSPLVPLRALVVLQVCSIPILNLAKIPQILLNWRRKATGELSPITLGLQLLGNVARIFTTLAQVRDPLMLTGILVATCFNTTLFAQYLLYVRRDRKAANSAPQLP